MDQQLWRRYWRRAYLVSFWLRLTPYVRMVGLNGSMVAGNLKKSSDIDFYVVLKKGRIFTGRFFVTLVVQLTGLRRYGRKVAGRICLNRYAASDYLHIYEENEYHAKVFHNLIPLFAEVGVHEEFCHENEWMSKFGARVVQNEIIWKDGLFWRFLRRLFEFIAEIGAYLMEGILRKRQLFRMKHDPRVGLKGSRVVISDVELRFHLAKNI